MAVASIASRAPSWVALAHPQSPRPARSAPVRAEIPAADPAPAPAPPHSFLAGLVAAGYGDLSVDEIVNLKVQGVSGDYLIAMSKVGWGKLPPVKVIDLKIQGVSPEYVAAIHTQGFGPYTPDEVIQLKIMGVSPELCRALK